MPITFASEPPPEAWWSSGCAGMRELEGRAMVVAVSGGPDSVALLRACHAWNQRGRWTLSVAHFHHGSRGEEADADALFVAELAELLSLPHDQGRWSPPRSAHFEADARKARYAWLAEVAQARGAAAVAVAHTRDDQAETVLHHLIRGTGLRGLAGMRNRRTLTEGVLLVRPLLAVPRAEILAYLRSINQSYRIDTTNLDTRRTRSRIRLELIPLLEHDYNPHVQDALARLAELAARGDDRLRHQARRRSPRVVLEQDEHRILLSIQPLKQLDEFARAETLRWVWHAAGWPEQEMSARRWRALAAWIESPTPGDGLSVGEGVQARWGGSTIELVRQRRHEGRAADQVVNPAAVPPPPPPLPLPLPLPGTVDWDRWTIAARWIEPGETPSPKPPSLEVIEAGSLRPPLEVRAPRPGESFAPLGMAGHRMPLRSFLRSRGVPASERGKVALLADQEGIVWVVGQRIADRVRIHHGSSRLLELTCQRNEPSAHRAEGA